MPDSHWNEKHRARHAEIRRRSQKAHQKEKTAYQSPYLQQVNDGTRLTADNHRMPWTKGEVDFLVSSRDTLSYVEVAKKLGRTMCAVKDFCFRNHISYSRDKKVVGNRADVVNVARSAKAKSVQH